MLRTISGLDGSSLRATVVDTLQHGDLAWSRPARLEPLSISASEYHITCCAPQILDERQDLFDPVTPLYKLLERQQFPLVCQVLKKAEFLICAFVKIGGKMRLGQLAIGIAGRNLLEGSGVCDGQDGRRTKTRHSTSEFVGRWLIHPRS